jgi:Uma2 family endonuclease
MESVQQWTAEAFEQFLMQPENADRRFELINGEIVEKMPTELHNIVSIILVVAFRLFVKQHRLGRVTYETRVRANPKDIHNDRIPDISFTRKERLLPITREGAVPQIPDLCVEVQSPDNYPKQMRTKAAWYLANGAQQVWILYTKKQLVEVQFADGNFDILTIGDELTGGDLLPGFSIPVAELFDLENE